MHSTNDVAQRTNSRDAAPTRAAPAPSTSDTDGAVQLSLRAVEGGLHVREELEVEFDEFPTFMFGIERQYLSTCLLRGF
jgi:hypothetical protein